VVNNNFAYYKLPTSLDVPPIEPIIVEGYFGHGPYGAKGVGETDIVPPAPAIANAIYHATGVRISSLPLSPEKLLEGLGAAKE
jgi:CO/xanthine dehydrogenase Mo-binding subunit